MTPDGQRSVAVRDGWVRLGGLLCFRFAQSQICAKEPFEQRQERECRRIGLNIWRHPMRKDSTSPISRRHMLLAGAGTAGALAAAANIFPLARDAAKPASSATEDAREQGGGYRLTQHVLRYYQTAKV
jgi:hypothetical protein